MPDMLPRRHFNTASTSTTTDIIRTRDLFNTKVIDANDVAGAAVVKSVIDVQAGLESRILLLESGSTTSIGTFEEFEIAFDLSK